MLNRWIEPDLLDVLGEQGVGAITFSPLAQGMLTDKYLDGIPEGSRATRADGSLSRELLTDEALDKIRALNEIANRRGQTLAQMALAWTLRDARITSTLIGASSVEQLEENVAALDNLELTEGELEEIDRYATDSRHQHLGRLERKLAGQRDDLVHPLEPFRAVGDEQHGLLGRRVQDVLHQRLRGGRVEVGGRLVEQQNRSACEEGACEHEPLSLAAGEHRPLLPDLRVQAGRERGHPLP